MKKFLLFTPQVYMYTYILYNSINLLIQSLSSVYRREKCQKFNNRLRTKLHYTVPTGLHRHIIETTVQIIFCLISAILWFASAAKLHIVAHFSTPLSTIRPWNRKTTFRLKL